MKQKALDFAKGALAFLGILAAFVLVVFAIAAFIDVFGRAAGWALIATAGCVWSGISYARQAAKDRALDADVAACEEAGE